MIKQDAHVTRGFWVGQDCLCAEQGGFQENGDGRVGLLLPPTQLFPRCCSDLAHTVCLPLF